MGCVEDCVALAIFAGPDAFQGVLAVLQGVEPQGRSKELPLAPDGV